MNVHNVHNYHVINMVTGAKRMFHTFTELTKSELLNNCDNLVAVRDNKGNLLEVDFTPSQRMVYPTGNTVHIGEKGISFNRYA